MPLIDPTVALSTRQEAFCRHYAASGNAADAARQAGYSERLPASFGTPEPTSPEDLPPADEEEFDPDNADRTDGNDGPEDAVSAPDHDKT